MGEPVDQVLSENDVEDSLWSVLDGTPTLDG
jgi:hypothetical protein